MKIRSKWVQDIAEMQEKYGVRKWVEDPANKDKLKDFMAFRLDFIEEEFEETILAFAEQDPEEIVAGLIDICVVAIGTLLAFDVDPDQAWDEIHKANMNKEVGYETSTWNETPWKFEAGTSNIAQVIGLKSSINYVKKIGLDKIEIHNKKLKN